MLVLTHLVSLFLNTPTTLSNKKVAVATAIHSLQDKIMDVDMFKPGWKSGIEKYCTSQFWIRQPIFGIVQPVTIWQETVNQVNESFKLNNIQANLTPVKLVFQPTNIFYPCKEYLAWIPPSTQTARVSLPRGELPTFNIKIFLSSWELEQMNNNSLIRYIVSNLPILVRVIKEGLSVASFSIHGMIVSYLK